MGVRTLLSSVRRDVTAKAMELWEEATGELTMTLNGGTVVTAETNPGTGETKIPSIPGAGIAYPTKAPIPFFGDKISISDVVVASGSPTISVTTGPGGLPALKIVTGVGVNAEISFPAAVGSQFNGETDILMSGGYADGVQLISFYATPDANYNTNFCVGAFYTGAAPLNSCAEQGGPYTVHLGKSTLNVTGSISYPFVVGTHKLRVTPNAGQSATVYLYGIGFNPQPSYGRICVIHDDGYDSFFNLGQPIFDALGIPVTCAVIPPNIDAGGGYAYMRQLKGLINRGGAVVPHGPISTLGAGNLLTAYPGNVSGQLSDMVAAREWIASKDLATPNYDKCYVWPQGKFQSSYADLALLDAALAAGFTTCRNANGLSNGLYSNFDSTSKYGHLCLPIIGHTWAGTTAAEATNITAIVTAINNAAAQGSDVTLMLHRVQPSSTADVAMNSVGIRVSDLTTIASAIAAKATAGTLKPVTLPQLAISRAGSFWQQ